MDIKEPADGKFPHLRPEKPERQVKGESEKEKPKDKGGSGREFHLFEINLNTEKLSNGLKDFFLFIGARKVAQAHQKPL